MTTEHAPLVLINAVGMTSRLLSHAPRLNALAQATRVRPLIEVLPAVTCTAQASLLTGVDPSTHGIVANGMLFRDTREVRFWQQANSLLQAEPVYATAKRIAAAKGRTFRTAKLFWWFNQGADVAISVTPKPHYGADGNKVFGVFGTPEGTAEAIERAIGVFPFHTFWGPRSGLASTEWIARCAAHVIETDRPDFTLVYLPHLDYEPQRRGPSGCDMAKLTSELDSACEPLIDAARRIGARVWVVSEYGHCDVSRAVPINRILRRAGLLSVRSGPFGEVLDTFESSAFAVCDHQIAHIYIKNQNDITKVQDILLGESGIASLYAGEERREIGLEHANSGEIVALSARDAWFAYPYWLDDRLAPDFARTVDIHRKPGFDPCELFFDPELFWPEGRAIMRLIQKKLGFRTLFDVIPLDPSLVRGSHALRAESFEDRPILIADHRDLETVDSLPTTAVRDLLLEALTGEREPAIRR